MGGLEGISACEADVRREDLSEIIPMSIDLPEPRGKLGQFQLMAIIQGVLKVRGHGWTSALCLQ